MAELTAEQICAVRELIDGGAKLGDIQKLLNEKFGINMTYMEVRFLVDDLDLLLKDAVQKPSGEQPAEDSTGDVEQADEAQTGGAGGVVVELSPVQAAGCVAGGSVTFSDGVKATWALSADGQLGLDGTSPDYRPSQADIEDFQQKLRQILSGSY